MHGSKARAVHAGPLGYAHRVSRKLVRLVAHECAQHVQRKAARATGDLVRLEILSGLLPPAARGPRLGVCRDARNLQVLGRGLRRRLERGRAGAGAGTGAG